MNPRIKPGRDWGWYDRDVRRYHLKDIGGWPGFGVYVTLAEFIDRTSRVCITHRELATETQLSITSIKKYIGLLVKFGIIKAELLEDGSYQYTVNRLDQRIKLVTKQSSQMTLPLEIPKVYPVLVPPIPQPISGHPPVAIQPQGSQNPAMHIRNKKSLQDCNQERSNASAHSVRGGPPPSTDQRHEQIKNEIIQRHAKTIDMPEALVLWDRVEDRALAKLLIDKPTLTPEIAKQCIRNFYWSDRDFQRRPAKGVIPQMLEFYGGEKTQYGHPRHVDRDYLKARELEAKASVGMRRSA